MLLEIQDIGQVKINRRRGQKRTTLKIDSKGNIKVGTNLTTSVGFIKKFVLQNKQWLNKQLNKSGLLEPIRVYDGQQICQNLCFRFKELAIGLTEPDDNSSDKIDFSYRTSPKQAVQHVNILLPQNPINKIELLHLSPRQKAKIEPVVIRAVRYQAKKYLPGRLRQLADRTGHKYNEVTIRNTSSRWGSCTSSNNLNLSLWLMLVPQKLSDYVLIHELAHTKFKNHKAEFWQEVARWDPDYKQHRKDLKRYHQQIWW